MNELTGLVRPYWAGVDGPSRRGLRLTRPVASGLVRTSWAVRVHARQHVPATGPVILASNHLGYLDGPLLCAVVSRPVHALVKQEMFRRAVGRALRGLGQIPVDRFAVDPAAVKACLAVLERGDALAIYPEGKRGRGDFATMRTGVAYLALCTGAPVVPVACLGTRPDGGHVGSLPRLRARVDVVFGPPTVVPAVPWPRRQAAVREQAGLLQTWLADHVRRACELTGRRLSAVPEPPRQRVAADLAPEPGLELDVEDVS